MRKIKNLIHFMSGTNGSLGAKVRRSGSWLALSAAIINIITLLRSVVLARLLEPDAFGLMSICIIVIGAIETATRPGFEAALIHKKEGYEEAKYTAFSMLCIRSILLAGFVIIIAPYVEYFYEVPLLAILLQVMAISFILKGFRNINTVTHEKDLDFKKLVYIEQLVAVLNTIIVISVAYYFRNVWALVIGNISAAAIGMLLSYSVIHGRIRFQFNKNIALELFGYGKFITGVSILLYIASEIDNAVVGKVLGMEQLGYYYLAFMLANMPATHISKIASRVFFSAFSKLQGDLTALRKNYLRVIGLIANITIPAAAGLLVLANEIISVVYGEKWIPSVLPLQILCILGALRSVNQVNGTVFNAIGKPNIPFYLVAIRVTLIAILIYPLTNKYGLVGAAYSVTIPMAIQLVLSMLLLSRVIQFRISEVTNKIGYPIFYSSIMVAALFFIKDFLQPVDINKLIVLILAGVCLSLVFSYRLIRLYIKG